MREYFIQDSSGPKRGLAVQCSQLLRSIPGRRRVYLGKWDNQSVIVKVFVHPFKAGYHARREWRGLKRLQAHGVTTATPCFYGKCESGPWAVVTKKVEGVKTGLQILNECQTLEQKVKILSDAFRHLAKQHRAGVWQEDLHLDNFLFADKRVYVLDPAQIKFVQPPLGRRKSFGQAALLSRYLPEEQQEAINSLWRVYAEERGWQLNQQDESFLRRQLAQMRKVGHKKALKKCQRTNSAHIRYKGRHWRGVFDRRIYDSAAIDDFVQRIDELAKAGEILKDGNTCFVSRINYNGRDLVVKRYNNKGLIHSLRHTIKGSRARRSWINAHRLKMLRIASVQPAAFIEITTGPIVRQSYFLADYVPGRDLRKLLADPDLNPQQKEKTAEQVYQLTEKLARHRISHGDLKHTNILTTENGPLIIDLDAMIAHRWNFTFDHFHKKDLSRLGYPGTIGSPN